MLRLCVLIVSLGLSVPALAGGIAFVDFQSAVNDSNRGKSAQKRLEQMYAARKSEIDKQKSDLEQAFAQYDQQKLILTDEARAQAEQSLMMKQQQLQQDMMKYQTEMEQNYSNELAKLDAELRTLSGTIAKEKGFDLVIDKAVVVYSGPAVTDMTAEVIRRYNAGK